MTIFYFVSILSESEEFSFVSAEAKALLKAVPNVYDVREDERGEEEARCENPFFAHVSFLFGKRELPESVFSISAVYDKEAGKTRIGIFGSGVSEVFCGLYTCLERSGFSFTSSGVVVPQECGFTFSEERLYTPAVKRRGVRLHLNFPMDISSYPLVRAKQYVRNLARLRYNAIAFHSYPGQFCEQTEERKKCLAGNYFYGEVQPIAEISYLKDLVENENYYCIPEGEVYYNDPEKSAAYAVFWLRTLMRECKKYGMKVVFSFEPRDMTYEETERTVKWIERNYPDADLIELCTEECGKGWDPAAAESVEEIEHLIRASYGSAFLSHPVIKEILPRAGSLSQLPLTLRQLNIIRRIVETNKEKTLRAMVYASCTDTLRICLALCESLLKDRKLALLPEHGARWVVDRVRALGLTKSHQKTLALYSWAEFDGNMYLLQNQSSGIYELLREFAGGEDGVPEILFNHWRTAENEYPLTYAAAACFDCTVTPEEFLGKYEKMKKVPEGTFVDAYREIEKADRLMTEKLPNIGFCAVYCWYNADVEYPGYISNFSLPALKEAECCYQRAIDFLKKSRGNDCVCEAAEFLINRAEASLLHMQAMQALTEALPAMKKKESTLDFAFAKALSFAKKFLGKMSEKLKDRGDEGVLVSYYKTIFHYIYVLRERYCGLSVPEIYERRIADTPPTPIF